jgi:hypothetical protein
MFKARSDPGAVFGGLIFGSRCALADVGRCVAISVDYHHHRAAGAAAFAHSASPSEMVRKSASSANTFAQAASAAACHWSRTSSKASTPTVSKRPAFKADVHRAAPPRRSPPSRSVEQAPPTPWPELRAPTAAARVAAQKRLPSSPAGPPPPADETPPAHRSREWLSREQTMRARRKASMDSLSW